MFLHVKKVLKSSACVTLAETRQFFISGACDIIAHIFESIDEIRRLIFFV